MKSVTSRRLTVDFSIFEPLVESVIVVDESNRIIFGNSAALSTFGFSERKFNAILLNQIISSPSPHEITAESEQRKELDFHLKSGHTKRLQFCVRRAGQTRVLYFNDVTLEQNLTTKYQKTFNHLKEYKDSLEKLLLGLLLVITGFQFLATKVAIRDFAPLGLTGIRYCAGAVVLAILFAKDLRNHLSWKNVSPLLGPTFLYRVIGTGGMTYSLKTVPSGIASVIFGSTTLWIYMMSIVKGREVLNRRTLVGLILGLSGLAIIASGEFGHSEYTLGLVILTLSTISFSVGIIGRPAVSLGLFAIEMAFGGICLFILSLIFEQSTFSFVGLPKDSLVSLIYLFFFSTLIAEPALSWLLSETTATRANSTFFVRPVVALIIGWLINNETLSWQAVTAVLLIFICLRLLLTRPRPS